MKSEYSLKKIRDARGPGEKFRNELRSSLVEYMANNPPELFVPKVLAPWRKWAVASFATLIVLCTGAVGTVFAAQPALPGDALYGIKLAVDQLAVDISRSPAVRVTVANRRIEEIRKALTAPSAETGPVQADVQNALKQYQSVLQGIPAESPTPAASPTQAITILRSTESNKKSLERMVSKNSSSSDATTTRDLKAGIQISQQAESIDRAALENTHEKTQPSPAFQSVTSSHSVNESTSTFGGAGNWQNNADRQKDKDRDANRNSTTTTDSNGENNGAAKKYPSHKSSSSHQ